MKGDVLVVRCGGCGALVGALAFEPGNEPDGPSWRVERPCFDHRVFPDDGLDHANLAMGDFYPDSRRVVVRVQPPAA